MDITFPVTYSTLSAKALSEKILPHYDIGGALDCTFINRGLNDSYLVVTTSGKYIIRVYRFGWRTSTEIQFELALLSHLEQEAIPVSAALTSRDNEMIHWVNAAEGMRAVVLFSYADGAEPLYAENEADEAFSYGQSAAQLHQAADRFQSDHQRFELDFVHLLDEPLAAIRPHLSHRPDDWHYLQILASKLWQKVDTLSASGLERGPCHGDFHGGNVHINAAGTLTFFDFDCGGIGWRAYDLAVFQWSARLNGKLEERWPHFLRGYEQFRPISATDLAAIPYFVLIRQIWLMGLHTGNAGDFGRSWLNDRYFDHMLKPLREWEAEHS